MVAIVGEESGRRRCEDRCRRREVMVGEARELKMMARARARSEVRKMVRVMFRGVILSLRLDLGAGLRAIALPGGIRVNRYFVGWYKCQV